MNKEQLIIIISSLALLLLERFFPMRAYRGLSKERKEDLVWSSLYFLIYPFLVSIMTFGFGESFNKLFSEKGFVLNLLEAQIVVQFILFLFLSDFSSYWLHRAFHSLKPLWEFHRLHHSTTELTVLSSFRTNWFDFTLHSVLIGFITGFLTVSEEVRFSVGLLLSYACIIQHANIKIKYPEFLEYIFITPRNHFWHHSKELAHTHGQNFGFLFPWWDMIFKTHYNPNHRDTELGLSDEFKYSDSLSKFCYPFDYWRYKK